ncbi:hypothetical protein [Limosilactobacillus reuteri]|uniref:hypothetical protein n=1 Tax=Limosilactobacillus reuteri TaxID=1598 RepID=UPI00129AF61C|nr:hypothetical protein [Limosilactobacillus reuteri]MRI08594.1 hypothetical protein [Limosilactobacillus reuteri]
MPEKCIIADARLGYPWNSVLIWIEKVPLSKIAIQSFPQMITLPIYSEHEDQKEAANRSLDELMKALDLSIPDLAKHQPNQVVAGSYARKLKQNSWSGWAFTGIPDQLKVIEITEENGISKHHHRPYTNYHFAKTDQTIDRNDAIAGSFSVSGWRYGSLVAENARPIEVPDDFLLWFNEDKEDMTDQDSWLVKQSLGIGGKGLQKIYYQMKFELADVLFPQKFYRKVSANQPAGIFDRAMHAKDALSGQLMLQNPRMSAAQIYWAGIKNKLPNHEWNGKWESIKG